MEGIKKPCAFVLAIHHPVETLKLLAIFIEDRGIELDTLQLHRYRNGDAQVIVHCQVERDRVSRTVQLLEQIKGVMEVKRLEGK